MPFSQIIPPSPSPTESKRLFYTSVFLLLSHIQGYCYHLSKFHIISRVSQVMIMIKNLPANVGDARYEVSIPGLERSPGTGNDNLLQYSCLENSMDRGA